MSRSEVIGRIICFTLAIILVQAASGPPARAAQPAVVGSVEELEGQVTVTHAGSVQARPVTVGTGILLHDTVRTLPGGKVRIRFLDESRISLASDSQVRIDEYVYRPDRKERSGAIKVLWGKVKCVVEDVTDYRHKKFDVTTDTAVIGVRGTEFLVWIKTKGQTQVAAFKKALDVAGLVDKARKIILDPGYLTDVALGRLPAAPIKIT
ncbi:MAG: FecR family protein, partial [Thermodesulfobacteriota bacterium]